MPRITDWLYMYVVISFPRLSLVIGIHAFFDHSDKRELVLIPSELVFICILYLLLAIKLKPLYTRVIAERTYPSRKPGITVFHKILIVWCVFIERQNEILLTY